MNASPRSRSRRILRALITLAMSAAIPAIIFLMWTRATHNFAQVRSGRVYRSGQMPASALAQIIRERQIKTVLNLRGSNPTESWYRDELSATREGGATHIDIAMSSCLWMSRDQLRMLVSTLENAEGPLLIHCAWGSERTGLAAAFAELLRPDGTLSEARSQFSLWYLFARINDGKVMAEHLDKYEDWLRATGIQHAPAHFRRWVNEAFRPGSPSREDWPYDPYPLVIVNPPGPPPRSQPLASGTRSSRERR